ncbi:formylglycine-generating enzyme family protein [Mesorhizobium sp. BR1-1-16]|uniref:formylglycine-generating enzyme family protein n=1 Tax=Mesorhizobium sp. BR1-1-16 TaxID=2876653 RepID=UPI001CCF8775|nr:SUMF1/EgtB/PvdO family nonheme iron enzyme [Mesorhizobium sp. BR1-1-16]MBZ9938996.1 formylglycine-generating enzyme family protein [Mesorhizobium sp. BR1-1-16]
MRHERFAAFVVVMLSAVPTFAAGWPPPVFNPHPLPDDYIIPLPCEGSMAFRRVNTGQIAPSDPRAPLYDESFMMGRPASGQRSFIESRRPEYITGAADDKNGTRYYLIGKYEVTVAQYKAVMAADASGCPASFGPAEAMPQTSLSWYDGMEFGRRLSSWLYADPQRLGAISQETGLTDPYIRLPTEVEWEFAARGGLRVSNTERSDDRFPMGSGGIDAYAWTNAPQSAQGNAKPIGTRRQNPLGLFDVYGNAAEIAQEPFRLTRGDRLHGEVGGFVVRGGSYLDDPQVVNSALRDEYPFFTSAGSRGEFRLRANGIRVIFGAAILNRAVDIDAFERAMDHISSDANEAIAPLATADLQRLAAHHDGDAIGEELKSLQGQLSSELMQRQELEGRLVRSLIVNAALMAREMNLTAKVMDVYFEFSQDQTSTSEERRVYLNKFNDNKLNLDLYSDQYANMIKTLSSEYNNEVSRQALAAKRGLIEAGNAELSNFVSGVDQNVGAETRGEHENSQAIAASVLGRDHTWLPR